MPREEPLKRGGAPTGLGPEAAKADLTKQGLHLGKPANSQYGGYSFSQNFVGAPQTFVGAPQTFVGAPQTFVGGQTSVFGGAQAAAGGLRTVAGGQATQARAFTGLNQVGQVGQISQVGQIGQAGQFGQVGQFGQSVFQNVGVQYQTVPVEKIEYQTVPVKVVDYQQVPVQVQQPVVTTQMRESYKGDSYYEYVPFERVYYEQVPVERIEYVPMEKKYTDYYAIEKQVEYVPYSRYETIREMVPQQKTEYVAQTKVEYVPQVTTEMVPVDRVQEKVDYQAVERTLVHYPQVERQFVVEAEKSGRIRTDLVGTITGSQMIGNAPLINSGVIQGQSFGPQFRSQVGYIGGQGAPIVGHGSQILGQGPQILGQGPQILGQGALPAGGLNVQGYPNVQLNSGFNVPVGQKPLTNLNAGKAQTPLGAPVPDFIDGKEKKDKPKQSRAD